MKINFDTDNTGSKLVVTHYVNEEVCDDVTGGYFPFLKDAATTTIEIDVANDVQTWPAIIENLAFFVMTKMGFIVEYDRAQEIIRRMREMFEEEHEERFPGLGKITKTWDDWEDDAEEVELDLGFYLGDDDLYAPDWDEAPDWANYHAVDRSGGGCWFDTEPTAQDGVWDNWGTVDDCLSERSKDFSNVNTSWRSSLRKRPDADKGNSSGVRTGLDPFMPDWSEAPEWAMFHAVDFDGEGWWYDVEPHAEGYIDGDVVWTSDGRYSYHGDFYAQNGWHHSNSIRSRPE